MALVTKPKTKLEWLAEFAPDYLPMKEDLDRAAIDAMDIGLIQAPEEIRYARLPQKISYIKQLPIEQKQAAVKALPESFEMCRICKSNCESRNVAWPPCGNPMLNKQFQYDLLESQGAFDDYDRDEKYRRLLELNPVLWAESEFTFTDKKGDKRAWSARWYQEMFLLCCDQDRVALWGRRMGKSESMIILCLHAAAFRPGSSSQDREYAIHVFAHSETLQEKHYREFIRFIDNSKSLGPMLAEKGGKKDSLILFKNGATIAFHVISGKQRGLSGKLIWFDEAAFYQDEAAIAAALGLRLEEGAVAVIMTSNSSGFRGRFYRFAHKEETFIMQLSAHYNPEWSRRMELLARSEFTDEEYELEVEAKWGEAKSAVFSPRHLDSIQEAYSYSYETTPRDDPILGIDSQVKRPGAFRTLGCDWNEGMNGVHFVITEYDPNIHKEMGGIFKVIHKSIITGDEWSHQAARMEAFALMTGWNCDAAYLDWGGGGSMAIPDLKRMLGSHGYGQLIEHIIGVDMGSNVKIPDPFQPDLIYLVPYKNVMVKKSQQLLQQHRLALPIEEYYDATSKQRVRNIIPQMRDYKVERINNKGQAVYSSDTEEHTLTAFMLSVLGCVVSCTDMLVPNFDEQPAKFAPLKEQLPSAQKSPKGQKREGPPIAIARNPRHNNPFRTGLGGIGLGSRTDGMSPRNRRKPW